MSNTHDTQLNSNERVDSIADSIASFSGSTPFFVLNALIFLAWIMVNTLTPWVFDAYPFNLLTMVVSLEAILLTILVLKSQNRQAQRDRQLAQEDYENNAHAKEEVEASKLEVESMLRQIRDIATHLSEQDVLILEAVKASKTTRKRSV